MSRNKEVGELLLAIRIVSNLYCYTNNYGWTDNINM